MREEGRCGGLHDQAARLITAAHPVPVQRLDHFRWLDDPRKYALTGWGGFIQQLGPVPGGYKVSVRVTPTFTVDGSSAVTADYVIEQYSIMNGRISLIRVVDPPDAVAGVVSTD
jgi:hypothetical protein